MKRPATAEGKVVARQVASSGGGKSVPSIFGRDMIIKGDVYSEGELHIEGRVEGNIKCRNIVIGAMGNVKGNITADKVKILGHFDGKIIAKDVILASSSYIIGEITHESLEIEVGAYLEGVCHRSDEPMPAGQPMPDLMISDLREKPVASVASAVKGAVASQDRSMKNRK